MAARQELIARVGASRTRLIVFMMLLVALLTALISVNGAVAALVPVVVVMAVRLERSPSQLLVPLAFGAHAGSLLLLTGTPVNFIVSDAAQEAGVGSFGFFEFALVGVPLVLGTIAIVALFGERLLPHRSGRAIPRDFSDHAYTLVRQYALTDMADTAMTRKSGVAEVTIPPRSDLVGETVFPGMVTESGDLIVLAVQRKGEGLDPGVLRASTIVLTGKSSSVSCFGLRDIKRCYSVRSRVCGVAVGTVLPFSPVTRGRRLGEYRTSPDLVQR